MGAGATANFDVRKCKDSNHQARNNE